MKPIEPPVTIPISPEMLPKPPVETKPTEPPVTIPISADIIPKPSAGPKPEASAAAAPVIPSVPSPATPPVAAVAAPAAPAAPVEAKPIDWKQTPRYAMVVDDEPANRDFLVRLLEQAKFQVKGASSAMEALKYAAEIKDGMCVVAIDNLLPDMGGVELLTKLRPIYPSARMIMATMLDERSLMAKAFENGCDVFLVKPHGFMELFRRLQIAVTSGQDDLKRLIIDQYGPRPYRG